MSLLSTMTMPLINIHIIRLRSLVSRPTCLLDPCQSLICRRITTLTTSAPDSNGQHHSLNVHHLVNLVHSRTYRHSHRQLVLFGHSALHDLLSLVPPARPSFQVLATFGACPGPAFCSAPHTRISPTTAQRIARTASPTSDLLSLLTFPPFTTTTPSTTLSSWIHRESVNTLNTRILVLNGLTDPGNVGTLFRTAAAFQFTHVLLVGHAVDPLNDKALRASKGTVLTVPWRSLVPPPSPAAAADPWASVCAWIQQQSQPKVWIAEPPPPPPSSSSSSVAAAPLQDTEGKGRGPQMLVLSGEAGGLKDNPIPLDRLVAAGAYVERVSIPMPGGASESLNVASAGAVLMWELVRGEMGAVAQTRSVV